MYQEKKKIEENEVKRIHTLMTLIILVRLSFVCAINSMCVIEQVDVCVSKQVTIFMNVCTSERLCVFVTAQKSGLT